VLFFLRPNPAGVAAVKAKSDRSCARSTRSSWFFAAALRSLPSTSWSCVWFAAKALVAIKAALHDPGNVLWDWDLKFGNDPCHWSMVTCQKGQIQELYVLLAHPMLCIYRRVFLFSAIDLCAFVRCSQVYDEQEPLWHTVAGGRKTQVAAISVSQKM
jgi:hypothetical protein